MTSSQAPADILTADELAAPLTDLLTSATEAERNAATQDAEADAYRKAVAQEVAHRTQAHARLRRAHRMATRADRPNSHAAGRAEEHRLTTETLPAIEKAITEATESVQWYTGDAARLRTVAAAYREHAATLTSQETPMAEQPATQDGDSFNPADPATWSQTPEGYEWREVDAETGEQQLFAPDGTNLSAALPAPHGAENTEAHMMAARPRFTPLTPAQEAPTGPVLAAEEEPCPNCMDLAEPGDTLHAAPCQFCGSDGHAACQHAAEEQPVVVYVDWTERVRGQKRGIMIFRVGAALDAELTAQDKEPQFRIVQGALGERPYAARSIEDNFRARADTITALAAQCATWLGLDGVTLDVRADDETR